MRVITPILKSGNLISSNGIIKRRSPWKLGVGAPCWSDRGMQFTLHGIAKGETTCLEPSRRNGTFVV